MGYTEEVCAETAGYIMKNNVESGYRLLFKDFFFLLLECNEMGLNKMRVSLVVLL
jgi:hypothetical protein